MINYGRLYVEQLNNKSHVLFPRAKMINWQAQVRPVGRHPGPCSNANRSDIIGCCAERSRGRPPSGTKGNRAGYTQSKGYTCWWHLPAERPCEGLFHRGTRVLRCCALEGQGMGDGQRVMSTRCVAIDDRDIRECAQRRPESTLTIDHFRIRGGPHDQSAMHTIEMSGYDIEGIEGRIDMEENH